MKSTEEKRACELKAADERRAKELSAAEERRAKESNAAEERRAKDIAKEKETASSAAVAHERARVELQAQLADEAAKRAAAVKEGQTLAEQLDTARKSAASVSKELEKEREAQRRAAEAADKQAKSLKEEASKKVDSERRGAEERLKAEQERHARELARVQGAHENETAAAKATTAKALAALEGKLGAEKTRVQEAAAALERQLAERTRERDAARARGSDLERDLKGEAARVAASAKEATEAKVRLAERAEELAAQSDRSDKAALDAAEAARGRKAAETTLAEARKTAAAELAVREQQLNELRLALEGGERANAKRSVQLAELVQQRELLSELLALDRATEAECANTSAAHALAMTEIEGLKAQVVVAAAEKAELLRRMTMELDDAAAGPDAANGGRVHKRQRTGAFQSGAGTHCLSCDARVADDGVPAGVTWPCGHLNPWEVRNVAVKVGTDLSFSSRTGIVGNATLGLFVVAMPTSPSGVGSTSVVGGDTI